MNVNDLNKRLDRIELMLEALMEVNQAKPTWERKKAKAVVREILDKRELKRNIV